MRRPVSTVDAARASMPTVTVPDGAAAFVDEVRRSTSLQITQSTTQAAPTRSARRCGWTSWQTRSEVGGSATSERRKLVKTRSAPLATFRGRKRQAEAALIHRCRAAAGWAPRSSSARSGDSRTYRVPRRRGRRRASVRVRSACPQRPRGSEQGLWRRRSVAAAWRPTEAFGPVRRAPAGCVHERCRDRTLLLGRIAATLRRSGEGQMHRVMDVKDHPSRVPILRQTLDAAFARRASWPIGGRQRKEMGS